MPSNSSSMTIGVIHRRLPEGSSLRSIDPNRNCRSYDCADWFSAFLCLLIDWLFPDCAQTLLDRASNRMRLPVCPHACRAVLVRIGSCHPHPAANSRLGRARDHGILGHLPVRANQTHLHARLRAVGRIDFDTRRLRGGALRVRVGSRIADQRPRVRIAILRRRIDPREPHQIG